MQAVIPSTPYYIPLSFFPSIHPEPTSPPLPVVMKKSAPPIHGTASNYVIEQKKEKGCHLVQEQKKTEATFEPLRSQTPVRKEESGTSKG